MKLEIGFETEEMKLYLNDLGSKIEGKRVIEKES